VARDLNDLWGWVQQLVRRVARLESGAALERSSITNGRMRFIGGLLRLDSGALLELVGQWRFFGNGAITGDVYSEGKWTQVGDYDFTGDGDLAGDVTMSGDFDLTGIFKSGNIRIQDGKIYVGEDASQIVIDGATGKITVGGMAIDPADGGKVTFPGGAQLRADVGSGIQMQIGNVKISAQATFIQLTLGTRSLTINSTGFQLSNVPTKTAAATGLPAGVAHLDGSGNLFRIT
jgi:hypothetical protein